MAKLNAETMEVERFSEQSLISAGVSLQAFLSTEDYNALHKDYDELWQDRYMEYPFWKYCLDHVQVTYNRGEEDA